MWKRLLVVVALISVAACGKNKNPAGPSGSSGGVTINGSTLDATIGGASYTPAAMTISVTPGSGGIPDFMAFGSATSQGAAFGFGVPTPVGTYAIAGLDGTNGLFIDATGASWQGFFGLGATGTITIKSRSSTQVTGSFDFTLVPSGGGATGTKRCVGTFTAKIG
jgi:hypothetical protein